MLRELAAASDRLQVRLPDFCVIPHDEVVRLSTMKASDEPQFLNLLRAATAGLRSDRIFARAQPLDESVSPGLSFAGVYESYVPRRATSRTENLSSGFSAVLSGRRNRVADYYYARHDLQGERSVDMMFSNLVEDTVCFGTAYVYSGKCLITYFDSPVSIFLGDPVRVAARLGQSGSGLPALLWDLMFRISELWTEPIDVEFLCDRFDQVFICQVRPMSPAHSRNWGMVSEELWEEVCGGNPPSNMVQSVGTVRGRVTDLRERMISTVDLTGADGMKQVYVVSHKSAVGTSSMDLLEFAQWHDLAGLAVVVDHGVSRRDDHMQYLMNEDPGIEFLVHTKGPIAVVDGAVCTVVSDGFHWRIA